MRYRSAGIAGVSALLTHLATPALAFDRDPAWLQIDGNRPPAVAHAAAPADPGEVFGLDVTPDDCTETRTANQALGGLLGGVAGGLIGSGIGKGSGRTAATIGGTVLGALGGVMLGNKVAEAGERCLTAPVRPDDPPIF